MGETFEKQWVFCSLHFCLHSLLKAMSSFFTGFSRIRRLRPHISGLDTMAGRRRAAGRRPLSSIMRSLLLNQWVMGGNLLLGGGILMKELINGCHKPLKWTLPLSPPPQTPLTTSVGMWPLRKLLPQPPEPPTPPRPPLRSLNSAVKHTTTAWKFNCH